MITRRALMKMAAAGMPLVLMGNRLSAQTSDVLRYGQINYPPNFQPWTQTGSGSNTFKLLTMRGLTSYSETGELTGELAESWEAEGESTWVFRLREAKFHNGNPVTAEDVRWTIEQVAAEGSTAFYNGDFQRIVSVDTPDERTVRLTMETPTAGVPYWFAAPYMPIINKDTLDENGVGVGAGPYMLRDAERGVAVELEADPNYWREGLPKARHLRLIAFPDESLRVAALRAGDLDMIEYVPWAEMASIDGDPELTLAGTDGPFHCLIFNGQQGPFTDRRVRLAAALAMKREDFVAAAFYGYAKPQEGLPFAEDSIYHNPDYAHAWRYDLDRAKALIAEAGVAPGTQITLLAPNAGAFFRIQCELIMRDLGELGFVVNLNLQSDTGLAFAQATQGLYDVSLLGNVADFPDPDGFSTLLDGSLPPAFTRCYGMDIPRITELLREGRSKIAPEDRKPIYDELQRVVAEEVPIAMLVSRYQGVAMRANVEGFSVLPGQTVFYSALRIEHASASGG